MSRAGRLSDGDMWVGLYAGLSSRPSVVVADTTPKRLEKPSHSPAPRFLPLSRKNQFALCTSFKRSRLPPKLRHIFTARLLYTVVLPSGDFKRYLRTSIFVTEFGNELTGSNALHIVSKAYPKTGVHKRELLVSLLSTNEAAKIRQDHFP